MREVTVVVVGGGQCGLAASQQLTARSIDHVVLERGTVANTWKTERWESLRLLTPNWQSRLPGHAYTGPDPDGFMTMPQVVDFLEGYAHGIKGPLRGGVTVTGVSRADPDRFVVETDQGPWRARAVVVASGPFALPAVPEVADLLPPGVASLHASHYRRPGLLEEGGVLVVGASATGIQLADEIHRSGRPVTLATGEHVRAPRHYRGLDIQRWMDSSGLHDQRWNEVDDPERVRRLPSMQLIGDSQRPIVDLNTLRDAGIRTVGRLVGVSDGAAQFSGSLRNVCALADLKLGRLLDTFDQWAETSELAAELDPPFRFRPPRSTTTRCYASTWPGPASVPWSGPRAGGPTTPGSSSTCSTARAGSATPAASPRNPAFTASACPS